MIDAVLRGERSWAVLQHDALLPWPLPDASVQTIVTSPPYWGLRDYKTPGQLGLEADLPSYVDRIVQVFREARRVLHRTATLWLNLGDCYSSHEYLFLFARSPRYFYDADAIREPYGDNTHDRGDGLNPKATADYGQVRPKQNASYSTALTGRLRPRPPRSDYEKRLMRQRAPGHKYDEGRGWNADRSERWNARAESMRAKTADNPHAGGRRQAPEPGEPNAFHPLGRNRRSVWSILPEPYPGPHFATFPTELVRLCILAGSREGDLVLDPFVGSGTVAMVAARTGRRCIGFDLSPEYVHLARARVEGDRPLFNRQEAAADDGPPLPLEVAP